MSQNNFRKEPTFGEPSATASAETVSETTKNVANASVSLHSSKVPSYTFTPVMKRPVEAAAELKSLEETQAVKAAAEAAKAETPKMETPKVVQSAGFTFSPIADDNPADAKKAEAVKVEKTVTEEKPAMNTNNNERVIPTPNSATTQAENTPIAAKVPSKFRRLGLVAILAIILGAIFFWLKPNAPETVEELQSQQGSSLPIEFRPVDEEEAKRAEAQAKAEQEALAQQQAQQQAQPSQDTTTPSAPPASADMNANTPAGAGEAIVQEGSVEPAAPEMENKPAEQPPVVKPKTQGSVIYQVESKAKTAPKQPKVKAMTADEYNAKKAKNAELDRLVKNVESGKPAVAHKASTSELKPKVVAKPAAAVSAAAVSSKTMTVPKSTSLMQVFRDNGLNIADVNAMSKVNNVVSNLKVGERVTVRLDKNNRVVEMNIGSGGKFTRQADGSYRFK